jgi:Xaa-Pro aminopeptidase
MINVELQNTYDPMKYITVLLLMLTTFSIQAQYPAILSQRDQAQVIDDLLEDRLRSVLPALMRREGIDMWVIISREYNEDPVIRTMLPATWFAARRTTMLVIHDKGNDSKGNDLGFDYLAVARYDVGKIFIRSWDPDHQPDQWAQLGKIIEARNPKKIAINKAPSWGHADGLTANDHEQLLNVIPKKFHDHVISAEKLAVAWLETRTEKEMIIYQQICRIAHEIITKGFSDQVIQPGVTTTDDVVWWYREEIKKLKLDTWFQPSVSVQRNEPEAITFKRPQPLVILPGDLLHVDFGITYLRLNTDTQQHAYILKSGETNAPEYLRSAFQRGNKLQDILTSNFKEGKTGNQILADTRKQAIDGGIKPSIYTHPIGFHGHAAGTTIGMWDMQNGVPFTGDYPMHYNTAYSIELNASVYIIEWKKEIKIQLEEDGFFDETGFRYIDGRQTEIILVPKPGVINK